MSREGVGALVGFQRELSLAPFHSRRRTHRGEADGVADPHGIHAEKARWQPMAPDPRQGELVAAGCQLPMRRTDRFRLAESSSCFIWACATAPALALTEETDAIVWW